MLQKVAITFDPNLILFQRHFQKEKSLHKWPVHLLLLNLKDLKKLPKMFKDIKAINFSALPLVGAFIAPIVTWLNFDLNGWTIAGTSILIYIGLYLSTIPHYFLKMLSISEDEYFHIGAYRKFCSAEYNMFSLFLTNDSYSFQGIYDFVTGVLTRQENELKIVEVITEQFNKDKEELKEEKKKILKEKEDLQLEKDETEKLIIEHYDQLISALDDELETTETGLRYLTELLADLNTVLYRVANECLNFGDLKILSGITVYKLNENVLHKCADEGTSGDSPKEVPLDGDEYRHYAMVAAVKDKGQNPKKNEPREGYYVISYPMKMKRDGKIEEMWVINFHVNRELNQKAWKLLLNNDIISNKEVYRTFHALCLFLYMKKGTQKEVVEDGSGKRAG
jgi:hypothetical protein